MGLRLQRCFGLTCTAGRWLVPGAGLGLLQDRDGLWRLEASVWVWNQYGSLHQQRRAQRWLHATGLVQARFPTRRAALEELRRLHGQQPLELTTFPR